MWVYYNAFTKVHLNYFLWHHYGPPAPETLLLHVLLGWADRVEVSARGNFEDSAREKVRTQRGTNVHGVTVQAGGRVGLEPMSETPTLLRAP